LRKRFTHIAPEIARKKKYRRGREEEKNRNKHIQGKEKITEKPETY
jgi:hypothetical protein